MSDPLYPHAGPSGAGATAVNSNMNAFCDKRQKAHWPAGCSHGITTKEDGTFEDKDGNPVTTISVFTVDRNGIKSTAPVDVPIITIINPQTIVADGGDCCLELIVCLEGKEAEKCPCPEGTPREFCDPAIVDACGNDTDPNPPVDPDAK